MFATDLGFENYEQYKRSEYWRRLRWLLGIDEKPCQRCRRKVARIPHHLHYKTLGRESRRDVVGLCFDCNETAHFYNNGDRVPVTSDGYYLKKRYREINTWWWRFKQKRPSDFFSMVASWYKVG